MNLENINKKLFTSSLTHDCEPFSHTHTQIRKKIGKCDEVVRKINEQHAKIEKNKSKHKPKI